MPNHRDSPTHGAAALPEASTASMRIDPDAIAVLRRVEVAMLRLKTYRATCRTTLTFTPASDGSTRESIREMSTLLAVKPNLMRYDSWPMRMTGPNGAWKRVQDTPEITFVSDGKDAWWQFGRTYRKDKRVQPESLHTILEPWDGFYSAKGSPHALVEHFRQAGDLIEIRRDGAEEVDGTPCEKVFVHIQTSYGDEALEYRTMWFVGADGLVRRKVERTSFAEKGGYIRDAVLSDIHPDVSAPRAGSHAFTYVPPEGVTLEKKERQKSALAAGKPAPDFSATDRDGRSLRLIDFKGKIVVLDFWASWCGPCVSSMPHNQEVTKRLQAEGLPVVLLALDNSEGREAFLDWIDKHPELDAITFAHADRADADIGGKLYHVSGIPTQYIIDADGIVRDYFVGYGGPTDDLEKAVRAAAP